MGISDSQEPLQLSAVEPDNDLVVYHDDGHGHAPGSGDQFLAGLRVLCDVLGRELNAVGRKKLFRRVTRLSGRGPVDGDLPRRHVNPL
jgi:hypothetical protein